MAEAVLRANSLRLRFERGKPEPTDTEIFAFMKGKMGLKSDNLLSMYKDKPEQSVIIKFQTEDGFKEALSRLPGTMEFAYNKYQSTTVQVSAANAVVRYVRIFNLPPEVDDREIWTAFSKYGKVQRTIREKYAESTGFPIWNSVRGVFIELKEGCEIPATVLVRNLRARVYYEGLVNKCFQCGSASHLKAECPNRASVNERLKRDQVDVRSHAPSYSGALTGNWSRSKPTGDSSEQGTMVNLNKLFANKTTRGSITTDDGEAAEDELGEEGTSVIESSMETEGIVKVTSNANQPPEDNVVEDQSTVEDGQESVSTSEECESREPSCSAVGVVPSVADGRENTDFVRCTDLTNTSRNNAEDGAKGMKRGRKISKGKRGEQSSSNTSEESNDRGEGNKGISITNSISEQQLAKTRSRSKQPKLSQKNENK